jgi:hypothetical protein
MILRSVHYGPIWMLFYGYCVFLSYIIGYLWFTFFDCSPWVHSRLVKIDGFRVDAENNHVVLLFHYVSCICCSCSLLNVH